MDRDAEMINAIERIVSLTWRDDGEYYVPGYTPDADDFGGDTDPGSEWDQECDRRLAEVRAALPEGWAAEWVDDYLVITDLGA